MFYHPHLRCQIEKAIIKNIISNLTSQEDVIRIVIVTRSDGAKLTGTNAES